jgi:benzoylformate decarboxylase
MDRMTGAQAIVRTLAAHGVTHVFGNPGTFEVELLEALLESAGSEYVLTLHEQATVSIADGYARIAGRPAFVNIHAMVGTANGVGALFTAHKDRTPMVVTAGMHNTRHLFRDAQGEAFDLVGVVRQFTRHSVMVPRADRLPEELTRAFKVAATPPGGPTFLGIPRDFFGAEIEASIPDPARHRVPARVAPDPKDIDRAATLLLAAERPILVAGGDVWSEGGAELLVELSELLALPAFSEHFPGFLGFPTTHPHYLGLYAPAHPLAASATALLGVACRMFVEPDYPKGAMVPPAASVVHIHRDPWEIGRVWPTDVGIVADSRSALRLLLAEARVQLTAGHAEAIRRRREEIARARETLAAQARAETAEAADATPIKPWRVVTEMARVLPEGALIVNQAVTMGNYVLRLFPFARAGGHAMTSSTYMGWATGAAIGMQMADPSRPVVCYVGDGGLVYGAQALWTAARYRVPVIFVIVNNRTYMAIKSTMYDRGGAARRTATYPGTDLADPNVDLTKLAESLGVAGVRVDRPGEIAPALERALGSGRPVVLDIAIDPEELGAHRPKTVSRTAPR